MPTNHITAIDNRGFFFLLPKLGIDENAHGLCAVKAAVGPLALANSIAAKLSGPTPQLKERKAADDCKFVTVSFRGGMWHLPKVAFQGRRDEIEVFAVYAKRLPAKNWPDPTAVKVNDEQNVVCVPGPASLSPPPITVAQLRAEHPQLFERFPPAASLSTMTPPSSWLPAGPREPTAAELDIEKSFSTWELVGRSPFRYEWLKEVRLPGKADTMVVTGVVNSPDGDARGLKYGLRREKDESKVQEHEWKPLPLRAMVPGMQRYRVNLCRRLVGHGPLPKASTTQSRMSRGNG